MIELTNKLIENNVSCHGKILMIVFSYCSFDLGAILPVENLWNGGEVFTSLDLHLVYVFFIFECGSGYLGKKKIKLT